ncbi:MAG: FAD-binding and (Fe-S)-binding domain-containing protein [Myxococcota bacterium]
MEDVYISESPRESEKRIAELSRLLSENISGDVKFDKITRILYATDASIYQIMPIGVVFPKSKEDAVRAIELAAEYEVPTLPRGAGTSLAGQTVGKALIIDYSRYMNRIIEVNPDERWARVEPGVIADSLNRYTASYGLIFGPDTSTTNRCNIGGMIGNNSCGAHSIVYGKTVDHVISLDVALADASVATFSTVSFDEAKRRANGDSSESRIYREILRIANEYQDEVRKRYPKILRRTMGYNLDLFVDAKDFNLSRMVTGSEGTLAHIVEAKVNLIVPPKYKVLLISQFAAIHDALEATVFGLESKPSAIELTDRYVLDLTKNSLLYRRKRAFIQGEPEAILATEFFCDDQREGISKAKALAEKFQSRGFGYHHQVYERSEEADFWAVRKAGLGLLMGMKGDRKPVSFVEDTAVPPERLPEYIRRFDKLVKKHGTSSVYYAHASVGELHMRPLINLKERMDVKRMQDLADEVSTLVLEFGGSFSGEHGDGLARSPFMEKMFGPYIYTAFKEVKAAFDPKSLMNPGKIVYAGCFTDNLRYTPSYKTLSIKTYLDFSESGGFAEAIEMCNGAGVCRRIEGGTMCPSYKVTRDEMHSTRGRANLLRAAINGTLPPEAFTGEELKEALDLCLQCKGCRAECPSNVDMAKLKHEFLAHYQRRRGVPLRSIVFGYISLINKIGVVFATLLNWMLSLSFVKRINEALLGIDRRRAMPKFAKRSFTKWWKRRRKEAKAKDYHGTVALFVDCFTEANEPEIGIAAVNVLETLGYKVILPKTKCCSRPMISKGLLKQAKRYAEYNVEGLIRYADEGIPIIGLEPSCILTMKDEYLDLVRDERAKKIARHIYTFEEFIASATAEGKLEIKFNEAKAKVLFHGHCHQKAIIGTNPAKVALSLHKGYEFVEIPSGCCGMAGSFGYEKEHYDLSIAVGEDVLFPYLRKAKEAGGNFVVAASGASCRHQIKDGTGITADHPAVILWQAMKE